MLSAIAEYVEDDIHAANACELFEIAPDLFEDPEFALPYIRGHTDEILDSAGFLTLTPPRMKVLLADDHLSCSEVDLFTAVLAWARARCSSRSKRPDEGDTASRVAISRTHLPSTADDAADVASELKEVVPLIRFPCMPIAYLAATVGPLKLFPAEQLLTLFKYVSISDPTARGLLDCSPFNTKSRSGRKAEAKSTIPTAPPL